MSSAWVASRGFGPSDVLGCGVVVDCVARGTPDAVCSLGGVESSSSRGLAQRWYGELVVGERCEGHESCRSGDVGYDEAVEVVEHGPGNDLAESSVVDVVCPSQPSQVGVALVLEDNDRGYPSRTSTRFRASRPARPLPSMNGWMHSKR